MSGDPQQEQALLQRLRASGNPAAQSEAQQLGTLYHDQQMGGLAADAYNAAKGTGQPPAGWTRASEHPELLAKYAPSLHLSKDQLTDMLKPDSSGFRAEIYLPDPAVLGPGYKPVVAFKGSSGDVMTSDGKVHSTTQEDFLANNFPQSVGMRTDYYDRAMQLASDLKNDGLDFELTGHSLAGGMAAAASAVTGNHATTWNAAGLHPETAKRFAAENPGVAVHDVNKSVISYQVQGELLNNGVQGNIHSLDYLQRQELGAVLKEGSQLLNQLPQGRELLKDDLSKNMPPEAQKTVHDFVDKVATGNTDKMLRELPLAAGQQQPLLAPMMPAGPDGTVLIARKNEMSLPEVTYLATPLLETAGAVAKGAQIGHGAGEVVAAGGKMTNQALHATGDGVRNVSELGGQAARTVTQAGGQVAQGAEHLVGATAAHGRVAVGEAGARVTEGLGDLGQFTASLEADALRKIGSVMPDGAQKWVDNQAQKLDQVGDAVHRTGQNLAADARRDAHADAATIRDATRTVQAATEHVATRVGNLQHDAIAGAGKLAANGLDATGNAVQSVADKAPAAGTVVGATAGLAAAGAYEFRPSNYPRLVGAAVAVANGKAAGEEALDRHGMTTVLPSLESRIENVERDARQTLQRSAAAQSQTSAAPVREVPRLDDPAHAGNAMFKQAREGVHKVDAQMGRTPDQRSDNLAGALAAAAKANGLSRIDAVALSDNGSRAFAVEHVIPNALSRDAHVQTAQAVNQPLAQSTAQWQQAAQQQSQTQAQTQQAQSQQQANPQQSAIGMGGR
jgi:hypothetical protein